MKNHLTIDGGLENGALGLEFVAKDVRVDQVAIVADGDLPARAIHHDGLRVLERARASGGIAHVADRARAGKFGQLGVVEDLRDQSHAVMALEFALVVAVDDNARTFLATVLQGVKPEEGYFRRVRMTVNGEHTAFILRAVWKSGARRKQVIHAHASYTPSAKKGKCFGFFLTIIKRLPLMRIVVATKKYTRRSTLC